MQSIQYHFDDLERCVDQVHDLFSTWEKSSCFPALDENVFHLMKLTVHEWVANLVQHADFGSRKAAVRFEVVPNGKRIQCSIEDNSNGFNFEAQLLRQQAACRKKSPPERGMGLLILKACTENLTYKQLGTNWYRLEFFISPEHIPCMNIRF